MMLFIPGAQTVENAFCVLNRRFTYIHRLESAFKSGVLFNMLTVFADCCSADYLKLTASQRRLDDVCGVYCSFGGSCADYCVYLVYKQDYRATFGYFLHDAFHSVLKFTSVFCPGYH